MESNKPYLWLDVPATTIHITVQCGSRKKIDDPELVLPLEDNRLYIDCNIVDAAPGEETQTKALLLDSPEFEFSDLVKVTVRTKMGRSYLGFCTIVPQDTFFE